MQRRVTRQERYRLSGTIRRVNQVQVQELLRKRFNRKARSHSSFKSSKFLSMTPRRTLTKTKRMLIRVMIKMMMKRSPTMR